ncbi:MAG: glutamyl-tRNA reductase [Gemmatimonadetes bacterium]|nr:glutamyl-tRNA reductase [Gemmatimonadota bacterium]
MALRVLGLSHHTAPVEVRERFVFNAAEVTAALRRLRAAGAAQEAVLLSTCNRTELYLHLPEGAEATPALELLAEHARMPAEEASRFMYRYDERRGVEHLFRVVSSLDSLVLGEAQIQGQVRAAYERALGAGGEGDDRVVGPVLSRLFQHALSVGGKVRSETHLGVGAASVPAAAVELARKIFGSLKGLEVAVLGAGEMSELSLEALMGDGARGTVIATRTEERARAMAERQNARTARFADLDRLLRDVRVIVCATAAPHAVLTRELMDRLLPGGPRNPLLIVDIALPRDVEPAVGDIDNIFLYDLDDLRQIVDQNLEKRQQEIPKAERIVGAAVEEFWTWYAAREVVPLIRALRDRAELTRQAEVERMLRRLKHLAPEDRDAIDALTRQLLNKVLHAPTSRLREAAANGRALQVLETARYLFQLDAPEPHAPEEPE